jgi:hypothetical protein
MGAWGEKTFENDSALDWLAELEAGGVAVLRGTLSRVADTDEDAYLDVDNGTSAIAAAEIVAAALGHGRDRLTENATAWLDANQGTVVPEDLTLANRAVERVLAGGSELRALWDENGQDNDWYADVRVLLERLAGGTGAAPTAPAANHAKPSQRAQVGERAGQAGARHFPPGARHRAHRAANGAYRCVAGCRRDQPVACSGRGCLLGRGRAGRVMVRPGQPRPSRRLVRTKKG